jgi:membrane protein YqaA with SNARE-associated domain
MADQDQKRRIRWLKLGSTVLVFVLVSVALSYVLSSLLTGFRVPVDLPTWLALLIIFGVLLVLNASVLPLPFTVSIMLVAAEHWNPVLVALAGSLGASLGELSGYFFGYIGKRVAVKDDVVGYQTIRGWILKYGMWAIALISFQPVIPFEIGGFIAGLTRMPVAKFLPAIFIGRFPKYILLILLGGEILRLIPRFSFHF